MLLDALREKNNIIFYGSGRVKNDIRKIKLKGSDRLWIRPVLKDERGVKKRERERIEAAKVSVKKPLCKKNRAKKRSQRVKK